MKLFSVAKIPIYCDGISHRLEKRRGTEVKVVDLTLRIQPFTAQLASAIDQSEYGFVKRLLFKMTDGSAIADYKSVELKTPGDRQNLTCFASPDTDHPSISLDQCKVTKLRARTQQNMDGWAFYVYVSFGPLGKTELEYVNAFYTEQRFISFEEAEPSLAFEDDGNDEDDETTDADEKAQRPAPMWEDQPAVAAEAKPTSKPAKKEPARRAAPRHADRKAAAKAKQKGKRR